MKQLKLNQNTSNPPSLLSGKQKSFAQKVSKNNEGELSSSDSNESGVEKKVVFEKFNSILNEKELKSPKKRSKFFKKLLTLDEKNVTKSIDNSKKLKSKASIKEDPVICSDLSLTE